MRWLGIDHHQPHACTCYPFSKTRIADVDPNKAMLAAIVPASNSRTGSRASNNSSDGGRDGSSSRPDKLFPILEQVCNAAFVQTVKTVGDIQDDVVRYRAIQMLLFVSCVFNLCVCVWGGGCRWTEVWGSEGKGNNRAPSHPADVDRPLITHTSIPRTSQHHRQQKADRAR